MKSNKSQHTHFLYYIFIIIIICSLVFHIVIIVIVITSCDNLKQIKQYCLFLLNCPVSSQHKPLLLLTVSWPFSTSLEVNPSDPRGGGGLGNTTTCISTALQSPVFAHAPHRYCATTICYAPIFELIIFCPRTSLMLWYFTAHTKQPLHMR